MSSNAFSTDLQPDPILRCAVFLSGTAATVSGLIIILTLPLDFGLRLATGSLWFFMGLRELVIFRRAYARYCLFRLDSTGKLILISANGEGREAALLSGGIVLHRLAWLRIETPDGSRFAELIRGDGRESKDWRRLQMIWRHFGTAS